MAPVGRMLHLPSEEGGWHQRAGLGEVKAISSQEEEGWALHTGIEPRTIAGREFPRGNPG